MTETNKQGPTLYQRAVQGGFWVILIRIFRQVSDLLRLVILARLLVPRDFGQMALALLSLALLETFTQVGIRDALVQRKEISREYLDTGWTLGILRAFVVFVLLFIVAPWITVFFDGSAEVRVKDLKNTQALVAALRDPNSPAGVYVMDRFPGEIRQMLESYPPDAPLGEEDKKIAAHAFSEMVSGSELWEHAAFDPETLGPAARKIFDQARARDDTPRANRLLLEEAFNGMIWPVILDRAIVTGIIRVVGLAFWLGSLMNIGIIFFQRDLSFQREFFFRFLGTTADTTTAIVVALVYRSVWALVLGRIAGGVTLLTMSYLMHPYRPRFHMRWQQAKELWKYGQHVMWTSILKLFILRGDDLFIAKILGPASLGLYKYAYRFANMAATEITDVFTQVTFPAFSRLQGNLEKMTAGYIKTLHVVSLLAFPLSGGLFVLAEPVVRVVLGEQWLSMVPAMRMLCLLGILKCSQAGNVFRAQGRPDIDVKLSVIRLFLIVISIYPLTIRYGLVGTAVSVTFATLAIFPLIFWKTRQMIGFSLWNYFQVISIPLFGTVVMTLGIVLIRPLLEPIGVLKLAALVGGGAVLYGLCVQGLSRFDPGYNLFRILEDLRSGWGSKR